MSDFLREEARKIHCLKIAREIRALDTLYNEVDNPFTPADLPINEHDILRVRACQQSIAFSLQGPLSLEEIYQFIIRRFFCDPKINLRTKYALDFIYQDVLRERDRAAKEADPKTTMEVVSVM